MTGLSAKDIPEMIARMREAGVIGDMTTKPSLSSLSTRGVMVFGHNRLGSLRNVRTALAQNDNVASGGNVYIAFHLRAEVAQETGVGIQKLRSRFQKMAGRGTGPLGGLLPGQL